MSNRISQCFARAEADNRAVLGIFVSAGDPSAEASAAILDSLVENGADFIELGMPFSDPMADGPAIQAASLRAITQGMTLAGTLDIAKSFRTRHPKTPLILMGYYNPIYMYGKDAFIRDALASGVDGLIIVDLPPEEDKELCDDANTAGLSFIRLVTPTTLGDRLPVVLEKAGGFVYYVAIAGITGTKSAATGTISAALTRIREETSLPAVTGFGIRTAEQAAEIAQLSDGVVVGSAMVSKIEQAYAEDSLDTEKLLNSVGKYCRSLSRAMKRS
jgi:tryptophan synthase alpha chain